MNATTVNDLLSEMLLHVRSGKRGSVCIELGEEQFISSGMAKLEVVDCKVKIQITNGNIFRLSFQNGQWKEPVKVESEKHAEYAVFLDSQGSELNPVRFVILKNHVPIYTSEDSVAGEIFAVCANSPKHAYVINAFTHSDPSGMRSTLVVNGDPELIELLSHSAEVFWNWGDCCG